jgi:hypothetical protein
LFSAGLVILLNARARELDSICIDTEFPGWEGEIARHLFRRLKWLRKDQVYFAPIGKKSNAHGLAIHTWRGDRKPDKRVTVEELLRAC